MAYVLNTPIYVCMAHLLLSLAVPAPSIDITGAPPYSLYAGTSLMLMCTFELHNMVDSEVTVNSVWRRGGQIISPNSRVNISTISMVRPSIYRTTLAISPLSNTLDSGQYTCQSAIVSNAYILYADASQQETVRIEGR